MASMIKLLRQLADPTRMRILLLLRQEDLSVAELQGILGMGQSRISSQLAQLKQAGLVADRRSGKNIIYGLPENHGLDPPTWERIDAIVDASAAEIPEAKRDGRALTLALKKRADKARAYFDELAGKFGRHYVPGRSWQGVAEMLLKILPPMTIADLGAGEGTLAQLLAQRAEKVIAIDNSEKMVAFGAGLAEKHGFANLEYRLGDIQSPPIDDAAVDLALFSQALHHARRPRVAVAEGFRILKPGGRIVILDLLKHGFEQARDLYADVWLGFAEVELYGYLEQAGFSDIDISIVHREPEAPHLQTLLALAGKPE